MLPFRGVVAGCGGATTLVKVYYCRPFRSFSFRHPCVQFDAYIDDTQLAVEGQPDRVVENLIDAATDFAEVITDTLGSEISLPKAALVTSDSSISKRIRSALGLRTGQFVYSARN